MSSLLAILVPVASFLTHLQSLASAEPIPRDLAIRDDPPVCTDGGTLYCCQATFSGAPAPIVAASNLTCYDITPEVVNCIISKYLTVLSHGSDPRTFFYKTKFAPLLDLPLTPVTADASSLPGSGCVGTYSCCQVTNLAPVLGLFCSKPPGDCVGGRDSCTNVLKDLPGCENA